MISSWSYDITNNHNRVNFHHDIDRLKERDAENAIKAHLDSGFIKSKDHPENIRLNKEKKDEKRKV